jgi:hypothetical protein
VIVAVLSVPFTVLQTYLVHISTRPVLIGGTLYSRADASTVLWLSLVAFLIIGPITQGATIRAIAGIYLGEPVTALASIRFAVSKLGWILLAILLSTILTMLGLIALLVGAVFVFIRLYFAVMAVVVEGERGGAIGRSWRLTKGRWWHTFGTVLIAGILSAIVTSVVSLPALALSVGSTSAWAFRAVLTSIATVIVTPFGASIGVVLYFDARIRKEGFDLSVMAREVGAATT